MSKPTIINLKKELRKDGIFFVEEGIMARKQIEGIQKLPAQFFIDHCKESAAEFAQSVTEALFEG